MQLMTTITDNNITVHEIAKHYSVAVLQNPTDRDVSALTCHLTDVVLILRVYVGYASGYLNRGARPRTHAALDVKRVCAFNA